MFDQDTSEVSWYRDLAAYCGNSDDHSKAYLMVFQIGKRKPLLKKEFTGGAMLGSNLGTPTHASDLPECGQRKAALLSPLTAQI